MKKIAYLLLILFALSLQNSQAWVRHRVVGGAPAAGGGLSVDNTTVLDQDATDASPWNFTHTTGSNANFLIVACSMAATSVTIDSITFNGDSMTEEVEVDSTGEKPHSALYTLQNPDQGITDGAIVVNYTSGFSLDGACFARSYTGANSTDAFVNGGSSEDGGTATDTSLSDNVTCAAGGQAISIGMLSAIRTVTIGQTETIYNQDDGARSQFASAEDGAGTNDLSYSWSSQAYWTHIFGCVVP